MKKFKFKELSSNKTTLIELIDYDDFMVCAPDQGAWDRCDNFVQWIENATGYKSIPIAFCKKKRCTETGAILKTELDETINYKDKTILIFDDICDRGATFVQLASKLKEQGAESVSLLVTHIIASKGLQALAIFENVYYINKVGNYF